MPIEFHRDGPWGLPEGWVWVSLRHLVSLRGEKSPPERTSPFPFIGMDDVPPNSLRIKTMGEFRSMKSAGNKFYPNDILYGRLRPYLNKVVVAELEGVASGEFIVMRTPEGIEPRYLQLFMHGRCFVNLATTDTSGDRPRIDFDKIADIEIPLAPTTEQHRIVTRIDELFTEIADGETALARARDDLDTWRRTLLKAAVTGELTREWREKTEIAESGKQLLQKLSAERSKTNRAQTRSAASPLFDALPSDWGIGTLEEIIADIPNAFVIGPFGSNLVVSDYRDSGVPLVFVRHIRANNFDGLNLKYVSEVKARQLSPHVVRSGDILITKMGEPPGDVAIYPPDRPDGIVTADCIKLSPHPKIPARWIQTVLLSEIGRAQIRRITKGVAQQKVNLANFRKLLIPIPSRIEMLELVRSLDSKEVEMSEIWNEAGVASALRQSILKAAFEGRLVEQDRFDEPAEYLLARLSERSEVMPEGRRSRQRRVAATAE